MGEQEDQGWLGYPPNLPGYPLPDCSHPYSTFHESSKLPSPSAPCWLAMLEEEAADPFFWIPSGPSI